MFLRVKQGFLLEVDMQRGLERSRLELSSLVRLEASEAAWMQGVREREIKWWTKYSTPALESQYNTPGQVSVNYKGR